MSAFAGSSPACLYPDHPRGDLRRAKGAVVVGEWSPAEGMLSRAVVDRVRGVRDAASDLSSWLEQHVGVTTRARR